MKLIIGLGNPGIDYTETRHNVGYKVIDELLKNKFTKNILARKTNVFMNQSGKFVESQTSKYQAKEEDLYIVHDDLDIPLGDYKIQFGKGPKDHNGLKSIDDALGTDEYWHVRIGIDNRQGDSRPMGEEYVLQNFSDEEKVIIEKTIKEVCKKLETL
ncbi:MAG: Peptidyl-tRNA hydrolase [uncultured bacterium]|nr:MAG: Peptidyl-tRNA hydrolase [uncultured bacterium]KKR51764.1 MAG: Peptidyl-tRNA hydrolase [Candidatus Woesebacteria bacterium GW2011_GWD2_40_19]KKR57915.1 MAG: Peptidyl-tRNA hydrolase [Candidatus Woesebacteria bacterium GW2011_GWC2_40_30]HAU65218.1 aminoacyl-tRNA hydrolase [Candidatus Woesebacteria bacterium]HCC08886.1 aminoacyl-tRNA hydrolase [Candidatus Woesebacteria bacterium]